MSYCRHDGVESDVYVIRSASGGWDCFCPSFHADSRRKMLAHLRGHQRRGDKVPKRALDRLKRELGTP